MRLTRLLAILLLGVFLHACSKVPVTGRKQVHLLPELDMINMSLAQYDAFLAEAHVLPPSDPRTVMVQKVGNTIKDAVVEYCNEHHQGKRIENFVWEFNVVDDPTVNAWCMPGGKVVFYTGILDLTQDEKGLAVVMGHEIAHAVARHGNERMSQQLLIQAGGATLSALSQENPSAANDLFLMSYGLGSQLGSLAFSRNHETESDKMGLVFMAMAGYNPEEAPLFWERMAAQGGAQQPQFLSTHPNHDTRIADLYAYMDEALKYYEGN